MTRFLRHLALAALLSTAPVMAQAACFADYKASKDKPLRLHYGVAQISGPCSIDAAWSQLQRRLAADGWTLQRVLSVFDERGLDERKSSAGRYYLRY